LTIWSPFAAKRGEELEGAEPSEHVLTGVGGGTVVSLVGLDSVLLVSVSLASVVLAGFAIADTEVAGALAGVEPPVDLAAPLAAIPKVLTTIKSATKTTNPQGLVRRDMAHGKPASYLSGVMTDRSRCGCSSPIAGGRVSAGSRRYQAPRDAGPP
jgi:hypothetical protein